MIQGWGGKMYFVYLPSFASYSTGIEDVNREFVMRTVTELGIPVIDIHTEAFALHPDPLSFFPFRCGGHYNAEGYRLVGESINDPFEKPLHEIFKEIPCLAPVKSIAYHLSRNVPAINENWLSLWKKNYNQIFK